MAGRKPLPTQVKILKGTARKDRINENEPQPKADLVIMPPDLTPVAKKQWKIVCKQLQEANIITNLDVPALQLYCESYALWREAIDTIEERGAVIRSKDGYPVRNPCITIAEKSYNQMKAMLIEFGMTPSSRTKVSVVSTEDKKKDFWGDFEDL